MNIENILKSSSFNANDKLRISTYAIGIKSPDNYQFRDSETSSMFAIRDGNNTHYFMKYKTLKKDSLHLLLYDEKKEYMLEHEFFGASAIPIAAYKFKKGQLTGKGYGHREQIRQYVSRALYISEDLQMYILYKNNKTNDYIICINKIDYEYKNELYMSQQSVYYFEIENQKQKLNSQIISLQADYSIPFILTKKSKLKFSLDLGEAFISCVDLKSIANSPYAQSDNYQNFIEIFNMIEI